MKKNTKEDAGDNKNLNNDKDDMKQENNNYENAENLKEFCNDMENLCEKYENEIVKYKKNIEEMKNGPNNINNSERVMNENNQNKEYSRLIESMKDKCDACVNTDELSIDGISEWLNIDKDLIINKKGNFIILKNFKKFIFIV